ncbi:MAG: transporter substrate-binding domain-containing protein [Treponema sp.]|nr:transporter substrate-binding domain-containing protein [Treponema sp.]
MAQNMLSHKNANRKGLRSASALAVAAMTLALLSGCSKKDDAQSGKDQLARIKEKGEIIIATEGTWAPWTYHDEANNLVGFDVDVAKKIAEKLGVKATFVETEWDGIFAGIDAKRYDMTANGVEITPERSEKYDFSVPYGYIHTALITLQERNDITAFEDLKGKTTANSLASTYADMAEKYGAKVNTIDSFEETIMLLTQKRIDATLNADVSFYDYKNVHPESPIKITATTAEASHVAIPLRKGSDSESLRKAIDTAIEELRQDGTIARISQQYFGSDISK